MQNDHRLQSQSIVGWENNESRICSLRPASKLSRPGLGPEADNPEMPTIGLIELIALELCGGERMLRVDPAKETPGNSWGAVR